MMRTLGFAAFGAVGMGGGRQGVMRPAHVAARRRGFSFWDRHGGNLLKGLPADCRRQSKGAWVAGKPARIQAKSLDLAGRLRPGFQPLKHGKGAFRPLASALRGLELHPRGPGIGIKRQHKFLEQGAGQVVMQAVDLLRRIVLARGDLDDRRSRRSGRRAGSKCSSRSKLRSMWAGTGPGSPHRPGRPRPSS